MPGLRPCVAPELAPAWERSGALGQCLALGLFSHGQVGDCPLLGEGRLSQGGPQGQLPLLDPPYPHRLVELAPQYYLSNLPPSESRDLLMELREKVVAVEDVPAVPEPLGEAAGREDEEREVCVLQ